VSQAAPAIAWAPFFLALATPDTAVEDEPGHLARFVGLPANLVLIAWRTIAGTT
jgi:hypothetical protein